jgi:hypothetical protein
MGAAYNTGLAFLQRTASSLPTVMARWVDWIAKNAGNIGLQAAYHLAQQEISAFVQNALPDLPNVNRISANAAMLRVCFETFCEFCLASGWWVKRATAEHNIMVFKGIVMDLAVAQGQHAVEEKPTRTFLKAIEEYIHAGEFVLLPRKGEEGVTALKVLVGYHDSDGVYLLPAAYDKVAVRKFQSQQGIGFSRPELYRLLREEGLLARVGSETTVLIDVGTPANRQRIRVLHLKPNAIQFGNGSENFAETGHAE